MVKVDEDLADQAGFGALEPGLQRQRLDTVAAGMADEYPGHRSMVDAELAERMRNRLLHFADIPAHQRRLKIDPFSTVEN
jgi:hypothetical protein